MSPSRRALMPALLAATLIIGHDAAPGSGSVTKTILLSSPTSTPARQMYAVSTSLNHIVGSVLPLSGSVPDGTSYTLQKLGGTGIVDVFATFYNAVTGTGKPCLTQIRVSDGAGGETGTVSCGDSDGNGITTAADRAKWVVVHALGGANPPPNARGGPAVAASVNATFKFTI